MQNVKLSNGIESTLDMEKSNIIDHYTAETAKFLNGYKIHE